MTSRCSHGTYIETVQCPKCEDMRRLVRSSEYLGMDRDELRATIVDRDEEIERLKNELHALRKPEMIP